MKKAYLDNAATTQLDPEVWKVMEPYFLNHYGNPSSSHYAGRESRAAVELARKTIAKQVGTQPSRLLFTSGATESNNLVFKFAVKDLGIKTLIISPLEHHAVLHPAQHTKEVNLLYTKHDQNGKIDLEHLENLLVSNQNVLVSVMHANNEIGRINPVVAIGRLCKTHGALFHSDTVQTISHIPVHQQELGIDFMVSSAHKYHGPKGVGFLSMNRDFVLTPDQLGGLQEKSLRAGTENVASIVAMAKALELVRQNGQWVEQHCADLKQYLVTKLSTIDGVSFHASSDQKEDYLPSILNVALSKERFNSMTLFTLDLKGIAVSGGSACSSGAIKGSHVLEALNPLNDQLALRISFSKYTTTDELDYLVEVLTDSAHS